ncbi:NADH-ubiquinone oxidoreductase chain 2 [Striga asiatica]|uniref:NADH-ubiquinone oxidoreductase chain 2 n=1 Tax=Striga asiatica TaxID=4170 RepID=A0A5A7RH83_STRAF|nr:NADH-ubiquinone oxidoreductase chain 2 [Striga asiatica]
MARFERKNRDLIISSKEIVITIYWNLAQLLVHRGSSLMGSPRNRTPSLPENHLRPKPEPGPSGIIRIRFDFSRSSENWSPPENPKSLDPSTRYFLTHNLLLLLLLNGINEWVLEELSRRPPLSRVLRQTPSEHFLGLVGQPARGLWQVSEERDLVYRRRQGPNPVII